jgi:hypothetical protein
VNARQNLLPFGRAFWWSGGLQAADDSSAG